MNKPPALALEISHVAGLDSAHTAPAHAPSPDEPVHTHESHPEWRWPAGPGAHTRWLECTACGIRDYYPGAGSPCAALPAPPRGKRLPETPRTLAEALERLRADLGAFGAWWRARPSLGFERPSMNDWTAEYLEWRRGPR